MGIRWISALYTSDVLHVPPFSCYVHLLWLCLPTCVSCPAQGLCAVSLWVSCSPFLWEELADTGMDAYSAMKSLAGCDYSRQLEGPALASSSFSELLHCWISEQWGWGCSAGAEPLLQCYLSHGLIQTSVAASSTRTTS